MTALPTNLLLEALAPVSRDRILRMSKHMSLPMRTVLYEADQVAKYAYFITSGIASVVIELEEGGSAEVALVGREGVVGGLQLLGPALSPARCFIQMTASGYRLPFNELKKCFVDSEDVRDCVLQMVQQQSLTVSQLAACNKLHDAEPRLARWLLMVQDRVQDDTLMLTQEFLAQMLGTQRTTVVMAAGALQRSGMISFTRGKVNILSREALVEAACDCYTVTQHLLNSLYK